MIHRARCAVVATLPLLLACGVSGSRPGDGPSPRTDVLTRAELSEVGATDAYDAVHRLRPRWLLVRSMRSFSIETEVVVFQGQLFLGNQDALRRIGIDGIYEMRYLDGATAQATLPGLAGRHVQGAIVIHMGPPPP
jgi:hypothetical protein